MNAIPLSLYIHLPWCVKKCPYCDFNSYGTEAAIPEKSYIEALMQDLDQELNWVESRSLSSIFFGGGTPSLFSASAIETILKGVAHRLPYDPNIEITLEANPGTTEHASFAAYRQAGINRISLGAQSFQNDKLKILGRIHQGEEIHRAIQGIQQADFQNFNIDLMFGLPHQTVEDAIFDLQSTLHYEPPHLSWYHLTLEPNTVFHQYPPPLPQEESLFEIQEAGLSLLKEHYQHYEVSAFSKAGFACRHNLNYWQFGDYIGIGAGAHGKISQEKEGKLVCVRTQKTRYPKSYLEAPTSKQRHLTREDLCFEFMLNRLRLFEPLPFEEFEARTGLPISALEKGLKQARAKNLIYLEHNAIHVTPLGKQFLNDLMSLFLPDSS